jgi:hypothetical protein
MALSPNELGGLTEDEEKKVVSLEKEIDEYLSRLSREQLRGVQYSLSGKLENENVRNELVRRYKEAGWGSVRIIEVQGVSKLMLG